MALLLEGDSIMTTEVNRWNPTGSVGGNSQNQDVSTSTYDSGSTNTSYSSGSSFKESNAEKNFNQNTANMTPEALAALNGLIQQLLGGGTQAQAQDRANRLSEIDAVRALRGDYTKEAAFGDAQGAMAQQMRATLEKLLPSIVRAAEGAGTSQNSMRALMLQDAASKAAESASALGLKAAVDYGGLSGNYSQVLEALTRAQQDPVMEALLSALGISKGAVQKTSGSETTHGTESGTSSQNTTSTQGSSTKTTNVDYQGSGDGGSFGQGSSDILAYNPRVSNSGLSSYSPTRYADPGYGIPGTGDSVKALYDANGQLTLATSSPWDSYSDFS